jgi:hypothetical protein
MATQSVADPAALVLADGADPNDQAGVARIVAWVERLSRRLDARAPMLQELRDYYNGIHPNTFATDKWLEVFGEDFGTIVDNWGCRVIDAETERMLLKGFRRADAKPEVHGAPDERGLVPADVFANEIWRRSRMHVQADVVHTDGLATGYSYVSVHRTADGKARLRAEDPLQTIVEHDPENGIDVVAALKRWRGLDGKVYATLYLPDVVAKLAITDPSVGWSVTSEDVNAEGVVPIFEFANNPDVYGFGYSDMAPMMSLGNAAEKLFSDMIIASEFAAYPQRVLLGAEVPVDAEGNPVSAAVLGSTRIFTVEDAAAKVAEFSAADLGNYTKAIDVVVQHIAALTQIPPHYLLGQMANLSGDALAAAESGLVSKVRRRTKVFGETWASVMELAYRLEHGEDVEFLTLWVNPERVSDAQKGDYVVKLDAIGVPRQALWEMVAEDPMEVARWMPMREIQDRREAELEAEASGISGPSGLPVEG